MKNLKDQLDAKIPRSEVSTREGGNGLKLSYLSNYYVKSRLNEVLGQGNWQYEVIKRELVFSGLVKRYSSDMHCVSYIVDVRFIAKIDGNSVVFVDTGYGDGTDKANPGKAHELAAKEAVTDALKRCVANLGQSMGLALYEKEQSFISEEAPEEAPTQAQPKLEIRSEAPPAPTKDIKALRSTVKSAAKVLDSQQKLTLADFKVKYKVSKVDELSDTEVVNVYDKIKLDFPELKLN